MFRAKTVLWFGKSFGLIFNSQLAEDRSQWLFMIEAGQEPYVSNCNRCDSHWGEDKSRVEKVPFLLEKFCVGNNFYHEVTMVFDGIPKSYLVKQRGNQLTDICHITSTMSEAERAQ